MAKYNNQKAKILFLQQMLYETGEDHTISMQQILDRLLENGIRAERKSIYDDMEVLRFFGMDIQYRRERPSGYYLAGHTSAEPEFLKKLNSGRGEERSSVSAEKEPEKTAAEDMDDTGWMKAESARDQKKQMKLQCSGKGKEEAEKYFGKEIQYKWRDDEECVVTAPLVETRNFFGWLTAMGSDVHLLKPRKTVQAYRDYLKLLAKEYKADK